MKALTVVALLLAACVVLVAVLKYRRGRRDLGTRTDRTTVQTLQIAGQAASALRGGLTDAGAQKAARHLRSLLGSTAVAITDTSGVLAWDGAGEARHRADALEHAGATLADGEVHVQTGLDRTCADPACSIAAAVIAPLTNDTAVVGTVAAYAPYMSAGLVRAATEVASWVSAQLELGQLERSRARLAEAEVRALRAQISPHFIYNSLGAIAAFVRTDPDRARELLLEFADFTRYSFRRHGDFTTLAEELRCIDRYLLLERARFGERLQVKLRVAPEVLPVAVPFLCLQPLVENAVQHGLQGKLGPGTITIVAEDAGPDCEITIEDDGVGMDPERLRRTLAGEGGGGGDHVGLGNVDERLRSVFGDEYGLVIETGPGAGTKVRVRAPKYRPGVRAS